VRILAVDDDPDILMLISVALEGMGHEITTTADPLMALGLLEMARIDAVVLDIKMPRISGYDMLEQIRRSPRSRHVPVVLLSSLGDTTEERIRGLRLGAHDFVRKPFDPEEIVVRLERIVAVRHVPEGGFAGDLEEDALLDVLQRLERDGRSGTVRVDGRLRCGWIGIDQGRPVVAGYGLLSGTEAVLGMLDLKKGFFSFDPGEMLAPEAEPADRMALSRLTVQLARCHDELEQRRRWLPDAAAALTLARPLDDKREALEHKGPDLPYDEICRRIQVLEGITLGELVAQELASPLSVCLAIAVLNQEGIVKVRTPGTEVNPPTPPA